LKYLKKINPTKVCLLTGFDFSFDKVLACHELTMFEPETSDPKIFFFQQSEPHENDAAPQHLYLFINILDYSFFGSEHNFLF
jgi:hypothetical protein